MIFQGSSNPAGPVGEFNFFERIDSWVRWLKKARHAIFNTQAIHLNHRHTPKKRLFCRLRRFASFFWRRISFKNAELFYISRLANLRHAPFFQKIAKCSFLERTTFLFFFSRGGAIAQSHFWIWELRHLFFFDGLMCKATSSHLSGSFYSPCAHRSEAKWSSFFWR